ncbi:MAG: YIP1 family protein [Clostridiales bacterium]|nr:YIP1 family protein [Clostridiales bacterium]
MKKLVLFALTLFAAVSRTVGAAASVGNTQSTSYTYAWNVNGALQISQDAYLPSDRLMDLGIFGAQDMYVSGKMLYVADTGNRRALSVNLDTGRVITIGQGILNTPRGISADSAGRVYVADTDKAYRFSADGRLEFTFEKPTTPNFGRNERFNPVKLAPSDDGGVYIVSEGTTAGIIYINGKGDFLGYFASNNVDLSLSQKIMNAVLTEEQKARFLKVRPSSYAHIFRGADGLIYTVNRGSGVSIKKHSINGLDLFAGRGIPTVLNDVGDICVTDDGRMFAVEYGSGLVVEIQNEGYLLCSFGGLPDGSEREGLFAAPTGVGVDSDGNLYVLDETRNFIQAFEPSSNQRRLYAAINLYENGEYTQSRAVLEELLKFNNTSLLAHMYIGRCYSQLGDYEIAAGHFRTGNEMQSYYSNAFWEQRNIWLQNNLGSFFLALLLFMALWTIIKRADKRAAILDFARAAKERAARVKFLSDLGRMRYAAAHPIDNAYNIKRGVTGGYGSGFAIYGLLFVLFVLSQVGMGFIYSIPIERFSIVSAFLYFTAALGMFVVLHYYIASINDGNGTLRDIFLCVAYGFSPVVLFMPFVVLFANVATFNEAFIIHIGTGALILWSVVNIVAALIEVHEYTFRETAVSLLITFFFMVVAVLAGTIFYVLLKQIYDFFYEIITEVGMRV